MKRSASASVLAILVLLLAGCDAGMPGGAAGGATGGASGGPWVTIDEERIGSSGSSGMQDESGQVVMKFTISNNEFSSLLEYIADAFAATIVVRPQSLLDRGITTTVTGVDAQETLQTLATQCGLQLEDLGGNKWRLSEPGSESQPEATVATEMEE